MHNVQGWIRLSTFLERFLQKFPLKIGFWDETRTSLCPIKNNNKILCFCLVVNHLEVITYFQVSKVRTLIEMIEENALLHERNTLVKLLVLYRLGTSINHMEDLTYSWSSWSFLYFKYMTIDHTGAFSKWRKMLYNGSIKDKSLNVIIYFHFFILYVFLNITFFRKYSAMSCLFDCIFWGRLIYVNFSAVMQPLLCTKCGWYAT